MSFNFSTLQSEVLRRGVRDQGGSQFTSGIKNIINTSLFRVGREALWRQLRRSTTFDTVIAYTTGTGAGTFTNGSKNITVTGATFLTNGIKVGRRIKLSGDGSYHTIKTITGETTLTIEKNYSGTTTAVGTYSILGQEEYPLPIQVNSRSFLWHEAYGFPYQLKFLPDQTFYKTGAFNTTQAVPTHYRAWGMDMVLSPLLAASVITIASSSSADTSKAITVFGTVSGYPDYEIISTNASNGTTSASGSKSFSSVDRIVKGSTITGRITVTSNSGNNTVAVLPVGDTTDGIMYSKVQLYPLPNTTFPINVFFYKDPFRLVNDGDVHELGEQFDEAIILLATAKIKAESNLHDEADRFMNLFLDEIKSLKKTNVDKIDWLPKLKSPYNKQNNNVVANLLYNQVGAQFGPSSY